MSVPSLQDDSGRRLQGMILQCVLLITALDLVSGNAVTQAVPIITVREGQTALFTCSYTTSLSSYLLYWYRHDGETGPQFLIERWQDNTEFRADGLETRFSMEVKAGEKLTTFKVEDSQLKDATIYYCAFRDRSGNVGKLIFGKGTQLMVESKKKSETAAFVLGSDEDNKKGKARACLITDFSSHNINVTLNDTTVSVDPSVIEGEEQYSVVAFLPESKERSNFNCNVFVNGTPTEGNNTDIENVCVSDLAYVFESDENLNSLSLMVLGLRVIFLKSIVFNVLMTVRAWMS